MPAPKSTDVILVARGEPIDQPPERLRRLRTTVTNANVLLVAPALALPGEGWIVDLAARASRARTRLQRWIDALADDASAIQVEIGDADPRCALADARREHPRARVIDAPPAETERASEPGRLMRLAERYGLVPAAAGVGW